MRSKRQCKQIPKVGRKKCWEVLAERIKRVIRRW